MSIHSLETTSNLFSLDLDHQYPVSQKCDGSSYIPSYQFCESSLILCHAVIWQLREYGQNGSALVTNDGQFNLHYDTDKHYVKLIPVSGLNHTSFMLWSIALSIEETWF